MKLAIYFSVFINIAFLSCAAPDPAGHVSRAVELIRQKTTTYKGSDPKSTEPLRIQLNEFMRTGKGEGYRSINYLRNASPAERKILMEAAITCALNPFGPYGDILGTYKNSLNELIRTKPANYRLDYLHQLTLYAAGQLAAWETEFADIPDNFIPLLAGHMSGLGTIDLSLIPDPFEFLKSIYNEAAFKDAFNACTGRDAITNSEYSPELKAYMQAQAHDRQINIWNSLLAGEIRDFDRSLFSNLQPYAASIPIFRSSLPSEIRSLGGVIFHSAPIYYDVIASKEIFEGTVQPKGVIINVYGADQVEVSRISGVNPANLIETFEEHIFAKAGYIYYRLYPRGTKANDIGPGKRWGPGGDYKQEETDGIFTLVRDVAYFAAKLKYDDAKINGIMTPLVASDSGIFAADKIKGKRIPIILSGVSFGGQLTLMTACSDEVIEFLDVDGIVKQQTIAEVFDGYFPKAPQIDIKEDHEISPMRGSYGRRTGSSEDSPWFKNAFPKITYTHGRPNVDSLAPYSIYNKMQNIRRPILVAHGLNDNNTCPYSTMHFAQEAWNKGVQRYISLCFEGEVGHFIDMAESADVGQGEFKRRRREYCKYFEKVCKFLDALSWHKAHRKVFTLSHDDMQFTRNLAFCGSCLIGAYSTHPEVNSPFERFAASLIKLGIDEHKFGFLLDSLINNSGINQALSTMLLASVIDLKSRDIIRNGDNSMTIDQPLFNLAHYWHFGRKRFLDEVIPIVFELPARAGLMHAEAVAPAIDHVLPRYFAWEKTILKDPENYPFDVKPYFECLQNSSDPRIVSDPKIKRFVDKMKQYVASPILNENPILTLQQIILNRLTDPRYSAYLDIVKKGSDIFSTPILNGGLGRVQF